ncbi:MAG: enoyl-CoA hydratase/isomerase family protein, partial [Proteobacteria bacterium]|nr:enoyl-CoA hydratase/isomerase family protein [Pseudomonadota bacterium]
MSQNPIVQTRIEDDIAWVTINNPPVNATSAKVRQGLVTALEDIKSARVAILMCDGRTFIAGGDMTEFDAPPVLPHLPDVVQMIEDSTVPFVAAMHGTVLGGGFEVAMACAWRIAAAGTRFGLPEVNVGIIPGAGGTQRLPRLIGMDQAIDIACGGKIINAQDLLALGGLDLIATGDLKQAAHAFVMNLPARPIAVSKRDFTALTAAEMTAKKVALIKRAKGQKAPLENLAALAWANLPFPKGQPLERARHMELRNSAESRALRYAFFAERKVARPKAISGAVARDIDHIAVVGGGLMGAGIATAALNAGLKVTMIERDKAAAGAGHARVVSLLDGALQREKITAEQHKQRIAAFAAGDSYAMAAQAQLAVEAVFEDVDVKRSVFTELATVMDRDAILATNTSYLDPDLIFEGIENPSRCLGLHFFSPAHIMKLLEIVQTPQTGADVLATGFALGKKMRKTSVLSGVCDGFIGNRMLAAYRRAADYILADGAFPYQVDAAMRSFGMPMGP